MTDDLDARLAALNARRRPPTSADEPAPQRRPSTTRDNASNAADEPTKTHTGRSASPTKRRRHAAPAARILALGLSVSATLAMTSVMSRSLVASNANSVGTGTAATATATPIVVHVVMPDGQVLQATSGSATPPVAASTPTVTRPAPAAPTSTRSRAS